MAAPLLGCGGGSSGGGGVGLGCGGDYGRGGSTVVVVGWGRGSCSRGDDHAGRCWHSLYSGLVNGNDDD